MGAFVLGYHGCDQDFGEALLAGERSLRVSKNAHDWLGHGIYFWKITQNAHWNGRVSCQSIQVLKVG